MPLQTSSISTQFYQRLFYCLCLLFVFVAAPAASCQQPDARQISAWEHDPAVIHDFIAARQLRRDGHLREAEAAYKRVLQRAPGLAVAHLNLGLVYHDEHDYAGSTREFSTAARLQPGLDAAQLYRGIDLYLWGHYSDAIEPLQRASARMKSPAEALYWLGLTQVAQGNLRAAAGTLEQAAHLRPGDEDVLYQLEETYMALWRNTYQRMVKADSQSFRIHQVLAEGYLQSNRLPEAQQEYAQVLRAQPDVSGVHMALGDIARAQGQMQTALKEYQAELKTSPNNVEAAYKLADLLLDAGDRTQAAAVLKTALAIDPRYSPALYEEARLSRLQGDTAAAIRQFRQVLAGGLSQDLEEQAHYQLFQLLMASGQSQAAAGELAAFKRLRQLREKLALSAADRERHDDASHGATQ